MKATLKLITLNETSYDVALLHKTLEALGLSVSKEEVEQNKAGPDTLQKVRALQKQLNVPTDESTVVNQATVAAIDAVLTQRGLVNAERSFIVTGTVRLPDGSVKKRQRVLAFDLDLRGVAVYRDVKTLADIRKNTGFEFLGQAVSGNEGIYSVTFYDWQYRRNERKKADVVVFAIDDEKDGRILGRSRLVDSSDYTDKGMVRGIDVTLMSNDTRTEYQTLVETLAPFLKENDVTFKNVAGSPEQLAFTAAELDLDADHLNMAAAAENLLTANDRTLSAELLYGIGRQGIRLDWKVLYRKRDEELRTALAHSIKANIVRSFTDKEIDAFLAGLRERAAVQILTDKNSDSGSKLNTMLAHALPKETQRASFVSAFASFKGDNFRDFWTKHLPAQPEFKDNPQLIAGLLLTQQLTALTGDHQALINELQVGRKLDSPEKLLDIDTKEWLTLVKKTGVPASVPGKTDEEKARNYVSRVQNMVNAAFPTRRIAKMVEKNLLPIEKTPVAKGVSTFLAKTAHFDIAASRVHDFEKEIAAVAGEHQAEVKSELMKIQRVFQISTSPESMDTLLQQNLHSAYTIANIPQKSFVKTYGQSLGGEEAAFAIHQRSSHVAARAEMAAMRMLDYTHNHAPQTAFGPGDYQATVTTLQNQVPNYSQLFGSPDLCECEHCRSVYSAAAYFVDLLRFLWRGDLNSNNKTPLDMLKVRRPDLLHLPLTCENTNTIIPYIDLANEVMEYYTANNSLTNFEGYDTGEATAEELRANPQNFNLEAYRTIKNAKYPFSLPYHQPLDVIRTYSDHLKVSRYDALKAMNPTPNATTAAAIAAEALRLSEEEYKVLTGTAFSGTADTTPLHQYFGYTAAGQLENMSAVPEFLHRSGIAYVDLVELVKTRFINPHQGTLDFLQKIFSHATLDVSAIYAKLKQIEAGTLNPASDAAITAALTAYNAAEGASITPAAFGAWVQEHLKNFRNVITLYQADSTCDLETTKLRTIESIYEGSSTSGISNASWSKIHRFIRLWRKLGWTLHETDLMLTAINESNITSTAIAKLESVVALKTATKLPLNQLAVFWGNIDTYGEKSLYKKLFLNKAVQQIDTAFEADAWGDYLTDNTEVIADHQSAILAAFRIREEELTAILGVAKVIDGGTARLVDPATDALNLANLSTLYRHVALAKALKMRITDLTRLIALFAAAPFSVWDLQQNKFTNVAPKNTHDFHQLAGATKSAGFKATVLEYIVQGTLPVDSTIGLDPDKARQIAVAIRDAFSAIEQSHPQTPPSPLTAEILTAKLALTFQPDIVGRFTDLLNGTATFEAMANDNLDVTIPSSLSDKYIYIKGSGRLTVKGIVSDADVAVLKGLANVDATFEDAVDELYAAPETFLTTHFGGIFDDMAEARATLLDHPEQPAAATLEEKLSYVYERFIPILKQKLRSDAITQHIAALIGLSNEATALLIADEVDALIDDLSAEGFSGAYFSDATWTTQALTRTDATIDFDWGTGSPGVGVPANSFSARWQTYLVAPASGDYTLVVDVDGADETFKLYLDDALILEKTGVQTTTSKEVVVTLNAAQMHRLTLEYAEATQDAAVQLHWKTATSALDVLPSSVAYPADVIDSLVSLLTAYHRAAKFITGFKLSETELNHLIAFAGDFGNIDFKALTTTHWKRINDYTALRNSVPQALALLTDVFSAANMSNPAPTVTELKSLLYQASAWDETNLTYLIDTHFALGINDFKNEIALNRVREVIRIAAGTGLSAETIADWGRPETDFDALHATAQLMKNTVKALYEETDWLTVAGDLSDTIRENQQQALIAHLLTRQAIRTWGAKDADGLFEYFLIDVQMDACMDTSRIVQANSSIQMFVNRCLLNLESDMSTGSERGVSPGAIDKDRWEWMKNYRVWEANRKVFLYPENWLEPEWRNDRSEFFKELESYLVQNDITDRSVEQAFRNYLTSLNEVANLDVYGMYKENYDDGDFKCMHVFARTHNAPYKFYYRRWDQYRKWSAWERVAVDVRSVEDASTSDVENNGVHLIPVVWKKRLFLFWPEFMKIQEKPGGTSGQSMQDAYTDKISELEPVEIMEIRLAWSEYVDGKWMPKQVAKEYLREWPHDDFVAMEKDFLLTPSIDASTQELTFTVSDTYWNLQRGKFILADIQSPVRVEHYGDAHMALTSDYRYEFSRRRAWKELELLDDVYLAAIVGHKLLPVATYKGVDINLDDPFFYSDSKRTYFVRPVDIGIYELVKNPDVFMPYLPGLVDDSGFLIPFDTPPGPDDYLPGETILPEIDGGIRTRVKNPRTTRETLGGTPTYHYRLENRTGQPIMLPLNGNNTAAPVMRAMKYESSSTSFAMSGTTNVMSKSYAVGMAYTDVAFGGVYAGYGNKWRWKLTRMDTGLEFHTFYHPFSSNYVTQLNQTGIAGLMESDTGIASDNGLTFEDTYEPNFTHGFVQKPSDFAQRTYYKENICFDVYGANSQYNWELFFHAPLYIATRLSKNGKYEEAMKWFHYIFDPTTDEMPAAGESEVSRYWKVLPFKKTPAETLEDWFRELGPNNNRNSEDATIAEWRDNPFDPHRVAANRPIAYMKNVVTKYVENLIAWADSLFRQDTMESVNEALQIYVIANHILGPRPQFVPKRGEIKAESYETLKTKWDDFSNALVQLENIFPYSSEAAVSDASPGTNLLGLGSAFYFCIPPNDKLLEYWDTVADRLYKIRHCQNIDGVERKLALFAPPIDPAALIQAASQGLSLGSILADLSSPPPIYRFTFLIQKANEFCADVKALGDALLAALEKKDAEELARMRASHETLMLDLITGIRERQILDARANKENLLKAREIAVFRVHHYTGLLGNDTVSIPAVPTLSATLTAESQLPADTMIAPIATDVDATPEDSGETGVKVIPKEKEALDKNEAAKWVTFGAGIADTLAGVFSLFPQLDGEGTPYGVGAGAWWGGQNLGAGTSALARAASTAATYLTQEATQATTMAGYIRREQEWTLQANLAAKEIIQIDKQIVSADIRIQIAEKELANHKQQIENAMAVESFLKDKFTDQELYQWMKEQLYAVYKQSYNLAYDMAKKAEKAYKYELGTEVASFIQYGYWDSTYLGLVAGEKLQLALRQLEKSYLEENRRELELTKHISLLRLNPLALVELRETGKCFVTVPEELFDLDFRNHYFRRLKSVSLSLPCIAGPHTSVSCSLRLLNNSYRINTSMNSEGNYERENDEGVPLDDDRFRTSYVPVTAIATSMAQNDSGMFEFNFRDERYLPFEGAGAISEWQIELSTDKELRQFDYDTISDVILHLNYTARENGGLFKEKATTYIKDFIMNTAERLDQPLMQMFRLKHEFPTEWYKFLHPATAGGEQILNFTLGQNRFPFFAQDRQIVVMKVDLFAKCTGNTSYHSRLTYVNHDEETVTSTQITMPQSTSYGGINKTTLDTADAGMNLEELDIEETMSLKLKRAAAGDYTGLVTDPDDEVEEMYLVVHYKLADA